MRITVLRTSSHKFAPENLTLSGLSLALVSRLMTLLTSSRKTLPTIAQLSVRKPVILRMPGG